MYGRMEISMKENGLIFSSMEKGLTYLEMEIHIKVNTNMENLKDLDNINGAMEVFLLENSKMV